MPVALFGVGTALCSAARMFYLCRCAAMECDDADVIVLDVLPTGLPALVGRWGAKAVLFYCHFPDKYLVRADRSDTEGSDVEIPAQVKFAKKFFAVFKSLYRGGMDILEELCIRHSDLVAVNSLFTRSMALEAFPSILSSPDGRPRDDGYLGVLYPPIDLGNFIKPDFEEKKRKLEGEAHRSSQSLGSIMSLNRFERKKNVAVLIKAYAKLVKFNKTDGVIVPPLVIAGGYDPRNTENVEHLAELMQLAEELGVAPMTTFSPSISDKERANLLRSALCVVYTPDKEHFGIVPLEAMYAGSPVVAVKSGGPKETVIDGVTGMLVEAGTVDGFTEALIRLVEDPHLALRMGQSGHEHVRDNFGLEAFRDSWWKTLRETARRGRERREGWGRGQGPVQIMGGGIFSSSVSYTVELMIALFFAWAVTALLRLVGTLGPDETILTWIKQ